MQWKGTMWWRAKAANAKGGEGGDQVGEPEENSQTIYGKTGIAKGCENIFMHLLDLIIVLIFVSNLAGLIVHICISSTASSFPPGDHYSFS